MNRNVIESLICFDEIICQGIGRVKGQQRNKIPQDIQFKTKTRTKHKRQRGGTQGKNKTENIPTSNYIKIIYANN